MAVIFYHEMPRDEMREIGACLDIACSCTDKALACPDISNRYPHISIAHPKSPSTPN